MKFVGNAWKLSPSDLTFLWDECPRCFWLKVAGNLARPRTPFPKIFTLIDVQTKRFFGGKRTEELATGVRAGRVAYGDRWVRSGPIMVPGHDRKLFVAGRFDTALAFDDGSFGIIDFRRRSPPSTTSNCTAASCTPTPSPRSTPPPATCAFGR